MGYDLRTHNRTGRPHEEILDSVEPNPDDPIAFAEAVYQALIENGDDFTWNSDAWPMLLRLAQSYGWKPAGTEPPYGWGNPELGFPPDFSKPWNGSYLHNDGQNVTAEDAAALADALERALDDIPDNKDMPPGMVVLQPGDEAISPEAWIGNFEQAMLDSGVSMLVPNTALHPFEFFGGEVKQKRLIPFIKFCRKGGFSIH